MRPERAACPAERMRIALLHPTFWPEVRRGSERLVHDLATTLSARGHDVTLLTSHEGSTTFSEEDGFRVVRSRRPRELRLARWYEYHLGNGLNAFRRTLSGGYDVAHAFFAVDALAALAARRLNGPPVIFSFHGIPVREYLVGRRYRLDWLTKAAGAADATTVLSEAASSRFERYIGVKPIVLPGGVISENFAEHVPRAEAPTLLCAASLADPYKRGDFLFRAFEAARRADPRLKLVLVESRDPFLGGAKLSLPAGASTVGGDESAALARAYGSAWATVLASLEEAFGLVALESLAAGTPVVASRSGGLPELVDQRVGRLFEPTDIDDFVRAIAGALELSAEPQTPDECRRRAADFDWGAVVERYEAVYDEVLRGRSAVR